MSQVKHESVAENDGDDVRSIEGSEWTLETTSIGSSTGDGNAQGNESNSMNALLEANAELEKLKEAEQKLKEVEIPIIHAIQEKIDESAKEMATQNVEHQKQIAELEKKCQNEIAKLKSKNLEANANFAKEMASLKEQLKEKINWNLVDLLMDEKIRNPIGNFWNSAKTKNNVSADGLNATNNASVWQSVSADKGFNISADFPCPVLYYFEVARTSYIDQSRILIGLSNGNIPDGSYVSGLPDSYATRDKYDYCLLSRKTQKTHYFEWANGAIKPEWNAKGDVIGCGILFSSKNKLSIFFTGNGILMGKAISINPAATSLYPTVSMHGNVSVTANFGDDSAKPFIYDIKKCPGMVLE